MKTTNHLPFHDPVIESIAKQYTLPNLSESKDLYLDFVENIISQQLSGRVATAIFNRFLKLFPKGYPSAEILKETPIESLREAGLSNAKANYVKNVAEFAIANDLSVERIQSIDDEGIISLLTQIKGVGIWTAQMLLIFSLNRPDVFPIDDLAIRQGMKELYGVDKEGKDLKKELIGISEDWKPHRTLGTRYVWLYVNKKKELKVRC